MSLFANDIDHTDAAWAYLLGQRFITAALACGFECTRTFVHDGQDPPAPPPSNHCQCQLAVVVTPGLDIADDRDSPLCLPMFTAEVTVIVDLCVLTPPADRLLTTTQLNDHARQNQEDLWRIMQGLMQARSNGTLAGSGKLTVSGWQAAGDFGGNARWQTRWQYRQ